MKRLISVGLISGLCLVTPISADQIIDNVSTTSQVKDDGSCNSVTVTEQVVAANPSRRFLVILAKSTNTDIVFIKLGTTATTSDFPLATGTAVNITGPSIYIGRVDAVANAGTQDVCIIEY